MKKAVLILVALCGLSALANEEIATKGCTPGKYTSDLEAAKAYAKEHRRFIMFIQGQNDGGCALCNQASVVYGGKGVKNWSKQNKIPMVYGEWTSRQVAGSPTYWWTEEMTGELSFPQAGIAEMDAKSEIGHFQANGGITKSFDLGGKLKYDGGAQGFIRMYNCMIESSDNTYKKARKLVATTDELVWGIYYDYGTNTLSTYYSVPNRFTDYIDWYCISPDAKSPPPAGYALQLKANFVKDAKNLASVRVFKSEADAKKEENDLADPLSLVDFGERGFKLSDPPANVYLKISRSDDFPKTEVIDVQYLLSVQYVPGVPPTEFAFAESAYTFKEDAGDKEIPVSRKGDASNVTFRVVSPDNAVEGVDYAFLDGAGKVTTAKTIDFGAATTAKIRLRIYNDGGVWKGPRVFVLKLDSELAPTSGSEETTVTIAEVHTKYDSADPGDKVAEGASELTLKDGSVAVDARVNADDCVDWYKVAVTKDSRVRLALTMTASNRVDGLAFNVMSNDVSGLARSATAAPSAVIDLSPKASGDLYFSVSRPEDVSAGATYTVSATVEKDWKKPMISFKSATCETDDTNEVCTIVFTREGSTTVADGIRVTCRTDPLDATSLVSAPLEFKKGAAEASIDLVLNTGDNGRFWKGDRSYPVTFTLDDTEFCGTNGYDRCMLTLKETEGEYEAGDPDRDGVEDETNPGVNTPLVALGESKLFARTLHGRDQQDFFTFTGAKAGEYVQISARTNDLRNVEDVWIVVTVNGETSDEYPLMAVNGTIHPITVDDNVSVRVFRKGASGDKPVSCRYELGIAFWEPPVFSFEKADLGAVDDTNDCFTVTVKRTGNRTRRDVLEVTTSNVTAFARGSAADPQMEQKVACVFEPEVAETNVTVTFSPEILGVHTGDRTFELGFNFDTNVKYRVVVCDPATARITLKDVDRELDGRDPADDTLERAMDLTKLPKPESLTKGTVAKVSAVCGERRLNGADLSDWYVFEEVPPGTNFCIGATVDRLALNNLDTGKVLVEFRKSNWSAGLYTDVLGTNTLAELVSAEWVYKPTNACSIAVHVFRPAQEAVASLAYDLTYRLQPPRELSFVHAGVVTVNRLATAAYVDVTLEIEGDEPIDEPVTAVLTPQACADVVDAFCARAGEDFDPSPVTVTWSKGSRGGVQRAAIPLVNRSSAWVGRRTFQVAISSAEAETDPDVGVQRVDIVDTTAPAAGSVAIAGISLDGGVTFRKPSSSTSYSVALGGTVLLKLKRTGDFTAPVMGSFTWKNSAGKTVSKDEGMIYHGGTSLEDEIAVISNTVPSDVGAQRLTTALTLAFGVSATAGKASVTKGTPASLKFSAAPADYAGTAGDYGGRGPTNVSFTASKSAWYLTTDGKVAAFTPASGAQVGLTTQVTGPGVLVFDAELVNTEGRANVYVTTKGVGRQTVSNGVNEVKVAPGLQKVQAIFARTKGGDPLPQVVFSDIRFVPDAAKFNNYGTFVGAVNYRPRADDAETYVPGTLTMTVASNGKVSGKIRGPKQTWTFKSDKAWDESNILRMTARCGTDTMGLVLSNMTEVGWLHVNFDPDSDPDDRVQGSVGRVCWKDRPLSAAAAAALVGRDDAEGCPGYYTMSLGSGGSSNPYGSGYLTFNVAVDGQIAVAGYMADGQKVSFSSQLLLDDIGVAYADFYTWPSAYHGGWYAQTLVLTNLQDGAGRRILGNGDSYTYLQPWVKYANNRGEVAYKRDTVVRGGRYDKTESLHDLYAKIPLCLRTEAPPPPVMIGGRAYEPVTWAGKAGENDVALRFTAADRLVAEPDGGASLDNPLTLSFNKATGVFTGKFKVGYRNEDSGKTALKTVTCRGVLTPWREGAFDADAHEGQGFYLLDGNSRGIDFISTEQD